MFVFVYSPYQIKLLQNLQIVLDNQKIPHSIEGGGGGGGGGGGPRYSGFQVTGMVKWGQKSKPIRITRPKINPQKSHATFLSLKNFLHQNDITQKIKTLQIKCLCLYIHHAKYSYYKIFRLFWITKKSLIKSSHPLPPPQKTVRAKFSHPKKYRESKISNPKNPSSIPIA